MQKYRIRLLTGKVIGPLTIEKVKKLYDSSWICGEEEIQVYPGDKWLKLVDLKEVADALNLSAVDERTKFFILKKLDLHEEEKNKTIILKTDIAQSEELDEKDFNEFKFDKTKVENLHELETSESIVEENLDVDESELEKTVVYDRNAINEEQFDKTVVTPMSRKFNEEKKEKEEAKIARENLQKIEEDKTQINLTEDATQFIGTKIWKEEVEDVLLDAEMEAETLDNEFEEFQFKPKELIGEESEEDVGDNTDDDDEVEEPQRKKIVLIIVFILFMYVLFYPAEKKEEFNPLSIETVTPEALSISYYDIEDAEKAEAFYNKALELYQEPTYQNTLKAVQMLLESNAHKKSVNTTSLLMKLYGELLRHVNNDRYITRSLFDQVIINKYRAISDPYVCEGTALFYQYLGKHKTVVKLIDSFVSLKSNQKNATQNLYAIYLMSMIDAGLIDKIEPVFNKLKSVKKKTLMSYLSVLKYYEFNQDDDNLNKVLEQAIEIHPWSMELLLKYGDRLVYQKDKNSLIEVVKKAYRNKAESSPRLVAHFLKVYGFYLVLDKKISQAGEAFKKSFSLYDLKDLKLELAQLESNYEGFQSIDSLIIESKVYEHIKNAKVYLQEGKLKLAYLESSKATTLDEYNVSAVFEHSNVLKKLGQYENSIKLLEKLHKKYPIDKEVTFKLLRSYITGFRFKDAKRLISIISTTSDGKDYKYFTEMGMYYKMQKEHLRSVIWFQKSFKVNPLDEEVVVELAKFYIRMSKFSKAKVMLTHAEELDPENLGYRVLYAKIVYETEGVVKAINYLEGALKTYPSSAILRGELAIYYNKNGELKKYEQTLSEVKEMPNKGKEIYSFLLKDAQLNEKTDEIIKNAKDIISLDPADLSIRMFLSKVLLDQGKIQESSALVNEVKNKLSTYPKLNYELSNIALMMNNKKLAKEYAMKEVNSNPNLPDGYILVGNLYKNEDNLVEAEKNYKKAQRINPENLDAVLGLAEINLKNNQLENSLSLYQKALKIKPNYPKSHKLIGDVYRRLGQSALAVQSYKVFLELSPNSRYKSELENYIKMMQ